jgi:hypothetical protein
MAAPALQDAAPRRPELTLPDAEAAELRAAYAAAGAILEYGSGGSTVLAGEMAGKRVFSVESDAGWVAMMQAWFAANPPQSPVAMHHADIGPTRDWGHPAGTDRVRHWPGYALSVWDRTDFVHPDVVLVDGRFRVACALATLFRIVRPVRLMFDDYVPRKAYHAVEALAGAPRIVGRMAVFDLVPTPVPADRLAWIIPQFIRPQ